MDEDRALRRVGAFVFLVDVAFVIAIILVDRHAPPPPASGVDTSAAIGWLSVIAAVVIFGGYGVLIKAPAVTAAKVDAMVFQLYYSAGCALWSYLIWGYSSSGKWTFSANGLAWGIVFGAAWNLLSIAGFKAIHHLGYAVAPAIWAGLTIVVSFVWGVAAFHDGVKDKGGAAAAILMLVAGISLAASTQSSFPARLRAWVAGGANNARGSAEETTTLFKQTGDSDNSGGEQNGGGGNAHFFKGVLFAICVGLLNGSLMATMKCFSNGCFGAQPYDPAENGGDTAGLNFLPYLSLGILISTPVVFVGYFRGRLADVRLHLDVAAVPGLLTGCYWAMGNYSAIFATMYLGQTIGFPLTQTAIVVNGAWGILYYKEISGAYPVGLFIVAAAIIIGGAVLDGRYA